MTTDCLKSAPGQSPLNIVAISDAGLDDIAAKFRAYCPGWIAAEQPPAGSNAVRLADEVDEDVVAECLAEPWVGLVELGAMADIVPAPGPAFLRHLREGGLGLCLRTDTAYRIPLASLFTAAVEKRFGFRRMDFSDLELVIHELAANAVIHGNLGVTGGWEASTNPLDVFGGAMDRALADPKLAARRVRLSALAVPGGLELAVEDDGDGYDVEAIRARHQDCVRLHGLALVEKMTDGVRVERGGRRVVVFIQSDEDCAPPVVNLSRVHVLVVDDNRANRELLRGLLSSMGVGRIEMAEDGEQGLAAVGRAKPDLILLDVMMPKMDGYEMCRRLRADHQLTDLPVIFITARSEPQDRTQCFAAGGTDMVSKPISVAEVKARVEVQLRHRLILEELNNYRKRVRDELRLAREAQLSLIPTRDDIAALCRRTGLVVEGVMETSSELGGDFWTAFDAGPGKLGLLVADFTGHGPAAAFNVFRLHLLLSRIPAENSKPGALLNWLNTELKAVLPPGQFAAAFVAVIDGEAGILSFASAGSPLPVLCEEGAARFLETAGPPLGAFADAEFDQTDMIMAPGASLLIYSDALVETEVDGTLVCDDGTLLNWVETIAPECSVTAAILDRFHERVEGGPPDDLTLVCVRRPARA